MTLRQRYVKRRKKTKTVSGTDIISGLPDDLLLKILLYLPTKVAISTCVLSKRWEFLWLWLPKLKYKLKCGYGSVFDLESERLRSFIDRTLLLHRAPVIESFHLNLAISKCFKQAEIKLWIVLALSHHLRKLKITYFSDLNKPNILPSNLYNCNSLVTLRLEGGIHLDVPRMVCLPSLKNLNIAIDKFFDRESLQRLLSICPVLEDLYVYSNKRHMGLVTINVPSLLYLTLYIRHTKNGLLDGFVIDTPSLEYFEIEARDHSCLFKSYMPNLEKAHLDFNFHDDISSLIPFITLVEHLSICLQDVVYDGGFVFNRLEHLNLCVCSKNSSSNLFVQLLEASPNLRVLDITEMDHYGHHEETGAPTTVGKHILSSLHAYD